MTTLDESSDRRPRQQRTYGGPMKLICPRDGGTLAPITTMPSGNRYGRRTAPSPVLTGYSCEYGHSLDKLGERPVEVIEERAH